MLPAASPLRAFSAALRSILLLLVTLTLACAAPAPAPAAATMKAVRVHEYGGLDALRYEDAYRPHPGPGEVLIRVHAAGVNPVDAIIRQGNLRERLRHTLPVILGWDLSGVVEELGAGVTRFKAGDAVFAYPPLARDGAYAEYIAVPEQAVARKPASIDHTQAAAVPVGALTAWQALVDIAGLKAGQTVLIHGGAGGVGTLAIQIAKVRGARVLATASARNLEYLKSLGADVAIDYQATRFEAVAKGVDVVLDGVGGETQERSFAVLKRGGVLVALRGRPSQEKAQAVGVRAESILVQPNGEQLAAIAKLIDEGRIKVVVSETFPLREAGRAQAQIETKHTRGKLVLRVPE